MIADLRRELSDEGDPLDYPCEECGAEPGEECRPYCTAIPSQQCEPEVFVRQHPGWWPALVEAVCQTCGWVGPTRDQNEQRGRLLIRCDQREHRCGRED